MSIISIAKQPMNIVGVNHGIHECVALDFVRRIRLGRGNGGFGGSNRDSKVVIRPPRKVTVVRCASASL